MRVDANSDSSSWSSFVMVMNNIVVLASAKECFFDFYGTYLKYQFVIGEKVFILGILSHFCV